MAKQTKLTSIDMMGHSFFFGSLFSISTLTAYRYLMEPQSIHGDILGTIIDTTLSIPYLTVTGVYMAWDLYKYTKKYTTILDTPDKQHTQSSNNSVSSDTFSKSKIVDLERLLPQIPKLFDNKQQMEMWGEKKDRHDEVLEMNVRKGYIIFINKSGVIDFDSYSKDDNVVKIKQYLELDKNDYFEAQRIKSNQVKIVFKEPFGIFPFAMEKLMDGKIWFGNDKNGKPHYIPIGALTHFGGVGATGSGKSNTINTLLISAFYNEKYFDKILLCDNKGGMEMDRFNRIYNEKVQTYAGVEETCDAIKIIYDELVEREEEARVRRSSYSMRKPILFLIDEFGQMQLMMNGKVSKELKVKLEEAMTQLDMIITKARALKIFGFFFSQKGTLQHFPSNVSDNLPSKIIMKTDSYIDSFFPTETFKELGVNPQFFTKGICILRDETGSNGVRFLHLKTPYIRSTDILSILPDVDKTQFISCQKGNYIILKDEVNETSNDSAKDELKLMTDMFKDSSYDKYINLDILNQYLDDNGRSDLVSERAPFNYYDDIFNIYEEIVLSAKMSGITFKWEVIESIKPNPNKFYSEEDYYIYVGHRETFDAQIEKQKKKNNFKSSTNVNPEPEEIKAIEVLTHPSMEESDFTTMKKELIVEITKAINLNGWTDESFQQIINIKKKANEVNSEEEIEMLMIHTKKLVKKTMNETEELQKQKEEMITIEEAEIVETPEEEEILDMIDEYLSEINKYMKELDDSNTMKKVNTKLTHFKRLISKKEKTPEEILNSIKTYYEAITNV
ncbi:MAG: FtsK/SpoIIIE domain-containing protein [Sulfuricurvum sp.]|nr:FtsK/SpoIIIE domain-containing protein [Sulfuricurvum sp.]MDP3023002.1 FtsK/SpoIIIE domain-containing protein [Sulfuricurvum sp.]